MRTRRKHTDGKSEFFLTNWARRCFQPHKTLQGHGFTAGPLGAGRTIELLRCTTKASLLASACTHPASPGEGRAKQLLQPRRDKVLALQTAAGHLCCFTEWPFLLETPYGIASKNSCPDVSQSPQPPTSPVADRNGTSDRKTNPEVVTANINPTANREGRDRMALRRAEASFLPGGTGRKV